MLRDQFGTQVSEADALPLPLKWDRMNPQDKRAIIGHLNGGMNPWPYDAWNGMPYSDRHRVTEHLKTTGAIPTSAAERGRIMHKRAEAALRAHRTHRFGNHDVIHTTKLCDAMNEANSVYKDLPFVSAPPPTSTSYGLYDKPNGRKRMLPSLYGKLRDFWVRGDGHAQPIERMNNGHLINTIKLLKESHGNVVGRATDLLGRMALHFQNQPGLAADLQQLCIEMQRVEVDEMYPVFTKLAEEFESRVYAVDDQPQLDLDLQDDMLEHWASGY